jgi:ABC-type lipoprotein release transport system permease subunit
MILKLALKNIIGYGWRSLINMVIIALMVVGMIWMEAMYYSWLKLAKTQQQEWEYGQGMFQVESYDPYDAFTWEDAHEPTGALEPAIEAGKAVPVLLSPGVIYPHQRMISAIVKGIPREQKMLRFPSGKLVSQGDGYVPAIIGKAMAKSSRLREGDVFTLRVKDSNGAFNTLDLKLAMIVDNPVPSMDIGTIWIDLDTLRELKQLPGMATTVAVGDPSLAELKAEGYEFTPVAKLFKNFDDIMKTENFSKYMIYGLLMFLAMLAIFDTQALALFKRRKEIGTFAALGMTKRQIMALFTVEGTLYTIFGIILAGILGFPMFYYFAVYGFKLPEGYDDFGIGGFNEPIHYKYPPEVYLGVIFWVVLITVVVSWLAARRIARMKVTEALKGKVG